MKWFALSIWFVLTVGPLAAQLRLEDSLLIDHVLLEEYEAAELALEKGANPTATNALGLNALHYAAGIEDLRFLPLLIQYGAYHSLEDGTPSPVFIAARHGNYRHLMQLKQAGYDLSIRTSDGGNALTLAVAANKVESVNYLLLQNVPAVIPLSTRETLLHTAAAHNAAQCIPRLLTAGLDPEAINAAGASPLSLAVNAQHIDALEALLLADVNPNWRDGQGRSLLMRAVESESPACVTALLNQGASPLVPDLAGSYPLHAAAEWGLPEATVRLLGPGADPNLPDRSGQVALALAIQSHHALVARILLQNGANADLAGVGPALKAVLTHDTEALAATLQGPGEARARPGDMPLLHWAILSNAPLPVLELLRERGADLEAIDSEGNTVWHHLVLRARPELVALASAVPADLLNANGASALSLAVTHNRLELVQELIPRAGVGWTGYEGWTLLHLAQAHGADLEIVQELVEAGLAPDAGAPAMASPLEISVRHPGSEVFERLMQEQEQRDPDFGRSDLAEKVAGWACFWGNTKALELVLESGWTPGMSNVRTACLKNWRLDAYRKLVVAARQGR